MIEVTAAMAGDGPKRTSQIRDARSMGSNGSSRGLPIAGPIAGPILGPILGPVQDVLGGLEGVQGAVRDLGGQLVQAALGPAAAVQAGAERGEGQRGDLL